MRNVCMCVCLRVVEDLYENGILSVSVERQKKGRKEERMSYDFFFASCNLIYLVVRNVTLCY